MDFLDPRKRRAHKIRLMIGYVLVAIAICLATVILVYSTNGYGINTKTGQIIENGLLFVDSKPGGAQIYLNGQDKKTTSARLVIPAGDYSLTLKKTGYESWQRSFTLEASSVERFVYPFLLPSNPRVTKLASYASQPVMMTQSPDQRWLLVRKVTASKTVDFDMYDTRALGKAPVTVSIPAGILTGNEGSAANLAVVEWSTDNNNVLMKHSFKGGSEFIVFNRAKPASSFNVNKVFKTDPDGVALFNKKVAQLYMFDATAQTVRLGTVSSGSLAAPLVKKVLAFKPYGTNLMTYVTSNNMPKGVVQARIWNSGKTYPLYSFPAGSIYLIDAAQYSGHWYYYAGSDTEKKINIYEDPINDINNPSIGHAIPTLALNVAGATKAGFSTNARFIEVENGQSFGVYDIETQSNYQYRLTDKLEAPLTWMDGHRLIGETDGHVFVTDYDSTNQHHFVATTDEDGGLFSSNYNHLFTFQAGSKKQVNLVNVDMRAGTDLPADPNAN
ncbi:MAG TPA: PEGA domain-containing protein [Candidatus Saccharimonadales bacterium]|nr:PEGA domain-containing protein [Candidatus Saccharimonadales bacterium]